MKFIIYIANGMVMPSAMFLMFNIYKLKRINIDLSRLPISIFIITITTLITSLQFVFPEIIQKLERNKEALFSGEIWRLITPLFVQPMGIGQCIFNGIFLLSFIPLAEHFYGRKLLIIYFATGIVGQIFNYYWNKNGGGSSTAIYGVIGSLFTYVLLHRNEFPKGYFFLPIAGFLGAFILCFFQDGHAPALLAGGVLSFFLQRSNYETKMVTPN